MFIQSIFQFSCCCRDSFCLSQLNCFLELFVFIISLVGRASLFDVIFNTCMTAEIAQLGERQTEDRKVPGSNPED